MRLFLTLLLIILSITGVARAETGIAEKEAAAREVTEELFQELSAALQESMQEGGPSAAVSVCRDIAPQIKTRLSLENGWRVTRVGTRVRNPLLGMPDAWESRVLAEFARRQNAGEALSGMSYTEVVGSGDQRRFRYMRAIGTQPACLACHGKPDQISEDIRSMLRENYPHDQAIGYQAGELRGAFSVTQPFPE